MDIISAGAQAVLTFWFGDPHLPPESYQERHALWFRKRRETDEAIRVQFHSLYAQAATGELDAWQESPAACLALIVVLDQFPRNLFRGTPQAFATDAKALAIAKAAIARHDDHSLPPVQRIFLYLPLEHSEDLADQQQSVALFEQLVAADSTLSDTYDYALRHRDVIQRFGRFPHRNEILGRTSTPEEVEFLQQPGSRF